MESTSQKLVSIARGKILSSHWARTLPRGYPYIRRDPDYDLRQKFAGTN